MESKNYNSFVLLPAYFKRIGIALIILVLATLITVKLMNVGMTQQQREIYKIIVSDVFMLSLLFIAMSKDKKENEQTSFLRSISLNNTLFFIVPYVLFYPLGGLLFGDKMEMSATETINFLMIMYLINYYSRKATSAKQPMQSGKEKIETD